MFWLGSAHAEADPVALCTDAAETPELTIAHCTSALESTELADTARAASLARRGLAWFSKRDLPHAAADLDEAIRLNAGAYTAYNSRAIVRMQQGDVDRAIADYDSAIRLKPDYAFALANRGNAWLIKGDAGRAVADLDAAIALAPARIELALTGRGKAWLAKGDLERATRDFSAALDANPKYSNALSGRGYARFCRGEFDAAAADFAQEHRLRPDDEAAIAWVIALRRAGHDARQELAQLAGKGPASPGMAAGLSLFSGQLSPAEALEASADHDAQVQRVRTCAANFQVGEWYLLQSDTAHARQYLTVARRGCDQSQPEYAAAGAELARLPRP
jgi:tetratricopeptide (TPR) repeat protein